MASPVVSLTCTFGTLLSKEQNVQECDATDASLLLFSRVNHFLFVLAYPTQVHAYRHHGKGK